MLKIRIRIPCSYPLIGGKAKGGKAKDERTKGGRTKGGRTMGGRARGGRTKGWKKKGDRIQEGVAIISYIIQSHT